MINDPELLADFLTEAGELVETLEADVLALEAAPTAAALNAVFRVFHTIKGGAGFLALEPLTVLCHRAEELCNKLRSGALQVQPEIIDVLSAVVDQLVGMIDTLRAGNMPTTAPDSLLDAISQAAEGGPAALVRPAPAPATASPEKPVPAPAPAAPSPAPAPAAASVDEDPVAATVAGWLDGGEEVPPAESPAPANTASDSDEITEDEFEALLDQLHGSGGPSAAAPQGSEPTAVAEPACQPEPEPTQSDQTVPTPRPMAEQTLARPPATPQSAPRESQPGRPRPAETSIRVDTDRLDKVLNQVGELVLMRNRLKVLRHRSNDPVLEKAIGSLDAITSGLQLSVMQMRMLPISKVFSRFPKIVRDLSRALGKEVQIEMRGEDTELDKNLVECLVDPLVHLVRNSMDHGIETPADREARHKPRCGTLRLEAEQAGDHILVTVADDGAGMDPNHLRRKAVEKGLIDSDTAARMDARECLQTIFLPGFSTRDQVSDVSGRGVGMDVVKSKIEALNGSVVIDSEPGKGTQLHIRLPLTLAILPTLMASVGPRIVGLPLALVGEVMSIDPRDVRRAEGRDVLMLEDEIIRLHDLAAWLDCADEGAERHVVLVNLGQERRGLIVSTVHGREEVVIKPLGQMLERTPGIAGAAVTGEGRVALILDVANLLKVFDPLPSSKREVIQATGG